MIHFKPVWIIVLGMLVFALGAAMFFPFIGRQSSILASKTASAAPHFWGWADAPKLVLFVFTAGLFAMMLFRAAKEFLKKRG